MSLIKQHTSKSYWRFIFLLFIYMAISPVYAIDQQTRIAFYYGETWPIEEFHAFDITVVSPNDNIEPNNYQTPTSRLFAYVSVGEVSADAPYAKLVQPEWKIAKNPAWNSDVMNLADPAWRQFLMDTLITPYWQKGYHGFFLDTLDSYRLSQHPEQEQQEGLVTLIKQIKTTYPDAQLILNRGFEIVPAVHDKIAAVAAESLYSEWNAAKKKYQPVTPANRAWLSHQLKIIQQSFHLPIIVIDYLPGKQRPEAREIAKKIQQDGFIPWVGNADLNNLGVGQVEVVPRRILILYSKANPNDTVVTQQNLPLLFPIQYMGYIPEMHAVDAPLPHLIEGVYAGIITLFNEPVIPEHQKISRFLSKNYQQGLPIALLGYLGIPGHHKLIHQFGLDVGDLQPPIQSVALTKVSPLIQYEITIEPNITAFFPLTISRGEALAIVTASNGQEQVSAAITPFGGYALNPFVITQLPNGQNRWVLNPFEFIKRALQLPDIPVPDLTTANGRRILISQIDGDLFVGRIPWDKTTFAGEVILKQILEKYPIPVTVSFIQREFEQIQTKPKQYQQAIKTAQQMTGLPWVETATHTYSHPLIWGKLVSGEKNTKYLSYPDDHYAFSYKTEIVDSMKYINTVLVSKKKYRNDLNHQLVFWSGDTEVGEAGLAVTAKAGMLNINGGNAVYLDPARSLTNLSAFGQPVGPYFHVFSPHGNDFDYTKEWSPPRYRYEQVLKTFKLTESPHRYKPIALYYHFYSAMDQGAFAALIKVYSWVTQQETTPIHIRDYVLKVLAFNQLVIAKTLNGAWLLTQYGPLKEWRTPLSWGFPEPGASSNILGFNKINGHWYVHLGSNPLSLLKYTSVEPAVPYLMDANAYQIQWVTPHPNHHIMTLQGNGPLAFRIAAANQCQILSLGKRLYPDERHQYELKDHAQATIEIECNHYG
jgi:hypothetical protein